MISSAAQEKVREMPVRKGGRAVGWVCVLEQRWARERARYVLVVGKEYRLRVYD